MRLDRSQGTRQGENPIDDAIWDVLYVCRTRPCLLASKRSPPPLNSDGPSVVINSYNRRQLLERALCSLYEHVDPLPAEIIVVDDQSTDGSVEFVEGCIASGKYPGLNLAKTPGKLSFAAGVNLGIARSRKCSFHVCPFETDNVATDAGLWRGVEHLKKHPSVAGVGFQVTRLTGEPAGNSMAFPSMLGFVVGQQITELLGLECPAAGPRRDVVFTSPLVVSREAISSFGLMDAVDFPFCDSDIIGADGSPTLDSSCTFWKTCRSFMIRGSRSQSSRAGEPSIFIAPGWRTSRSTVLGRCPPSGPGFWRDTVSSSRASSSRARGPGSRWACGRTVGAAAPLAAELS